MQWKTSDPATMETRATKTRRMHVTVFPTDCRGAVVMPDLLAFSPPPPPNDINGVGHYGGR